jgi:D-amino-acid dehydrogenase
VNKSVVIIGGGLIGLSTASFLLDQGADVTIVDHGELGGGAARGNAGFMCNTLLEPLAGPGALKNALTSLNDPTRALRLHPRALPGMLGWGVHFARSSTAARYNAGRVALAKLNLRSAEALKLLGSLGANVQLGNQLVVPFHDPAVAAEFLARLKPMADFGVELPSGLLDGDELRKVIPALTDHVRAGYIVPQDRSIDPRVLVDSMIQALRARGATFLENSPVVSVDRVGRRIRSIKTANGVIEGSEFLLSAGAGSRGLGKLFDLRIPVIPGQGYNVGLPTTDTLVNPVIFEEAHAVATPFQDRIRLGGTMEFDGDQPRFDQRRVEAIITSLRKYLNLDWDRRFDTWAGSRPMTADGLPLMGRPRDFDNLVISAGHGMFGLSLAPASGLALAELITSGGTATDLTDFNPDRFRFPIRRSA